MGLLVSVPFCALIVFFFVRIVILNKYSPIKTTFYSITSDASLAKQFSRSNHLRIFVKVIFFTSYFPCTTRTTMQLKLKKDFLLDLSKIKMKRSQAQMESIIAWRWFIQMVKKFKIFVILLFLSLSFLYRSLSRSLDYRVNSFIASPSTYFLDYVDSRK